MVKSGGPIQKVAVFEVPLMSGENAHWMYLRQNDKLSLGKCY
jgi:hypothetical protein